MTKIEDFVRFQKENGKFEEHRKAQLEKKIKNILQEKVSRMIIEKLGEFVDFDRIIANIYEHKGDPYTAAKELFDKVAS